MRPVLSAQQMRDFDRHAGEVRQVPSLTLMENAGRGAASFVQRFVAERGMTAPCVVVVCGSGNNGGDGFVVARHLAGANVQVETLLVQPAARLRGDALINYKALGAVSADLVELTDEVGPLKEALSRADVVVDAVLGTGADREVTGFLAQVIGAINAAPGHKIALDLPSGLHADTGRVLGTAVQADATVTFAHPKLGLCTPRGRLLSGSVEVCDLGVPEDPSETGMSAEVVELEDVMALVEPRAGTLHKSSAGRVLVIAGSPGKLGAALLSAHGALRAGAGLVTIATSPAAADALDHRVLEVMTARIEPTGPAASLAPLLSSCRALVIGPGLGLDDFARRVVEAAVFGWEGPKVLDADAISLFAGRGGELARAKNLIITPHAGELARLLGTSAEAIEDDRFAAVAQAVSLTSAVVLLKGHFSIVGAPGCVPALSSTGGPVLATGGTGDVLSGVIAALACALSPREAAFIGAFLHGAAADRWAKEHHTDRGMLAHELGDQLPATIGALLERAGKRRPRAVTAC
jgi:ADP-dependent NAD(P)H-hydrate dehydratase / NAD(P)H-hydrate epimerase